MTQLIDARELAERLAVSRGTLRNWVRRGLLPAPVTQGDGKSLWIRRQIFSWLEENDPAEDLGDLWTLAELASALKVSRATINRMRARGDLPKPLKIGSVLRWRTEDLREWERQKIESAETS